MTDVIKASNHRPEPTIPRLVLHVRGRDRVRQADAI